MAGRPPYEKGLGVSSFSPVTEMTTGSDLTTRSCPLEWAPNRRALSTFGLGLGVSLDTNRDSPLIELAAVELMSEVGISSYRLNVPWEVVASKSDCGIDHRALDRLAATAERLLHAGIDPLIALDNATLPDDLAADGGWRNPATVRAFGSFVGAVGARLGDLADRWITMATTLPVRLDASVLSTLIAAQTEAAITLRAHAPHASLGASIDTALFDPSLPAATQEAAHSWVAHLASPAAAVDFVSINAGRAGQRPPAVLAGLIRWLDHHIPSRSFIVTEARPVPAALTRHLVESDAQPDRYDLVDAFLDEVRGLRADQIDVSGAFVWPFTGTTATTSDVTDAAIERCRRILAAGID